MNTQLDLQPLSNCLRMLSADAVQHAHSGHPGMPLGMADVVTTLFAQYLKFYPLDPQWADRDRFVLSAGHGSMLLYALLHLTGYEDFSMDQIRKFRQLHARTAGHPEFGHGRGIETTTGPLGQGLGNAVGMAIAERKLAADFGHELVHHRTYVIVGDGCLMEGISQEAISLAGHLRLNKLIVLWDDNQISIDGSTQLTTSENTMDRFVAAGWQTLCCDGHDFVSISKALEQAQYSTDTPVMIACKTIIGKGAPNKSGSADVHGSPLGKEEVNLLREQLGWTNEPFDIPTEWAAQWHAIGTRHQDAYQSWTKRVQESPHRAEFLRVQTAQLSQSLVQKIKDVKTLAVGKGSKISTRKASQVVLENLLPNMPELLGGSADLSGSNCTKVAAHSPFTATHPKGNYLHYGVREHGMAAAMNGIALHGGLIPYGGSFLVFTDYCRPSIRLSALMNIRVIYVMTHDSIGLGEDGPTHQPVETLSALRVIPNLSVFRPCDLVETAECWELALSQELSKPSILALSRQDLPLLRTKHHDENQSQFGGYVLQAEIAAHRVTLMASGSEVCIAQQAQQSLEAQGIGTRLVSVPCMERFTAAEAGYRKKILGNHAVLASIEAAHVQSWLAFPERPDICIGMDCFGASGKIDDLYQHFGITSEALTQAVLEKLA